MRSRFKITIKTYRGFILDGTPHITATSLMPLFYYNMVMDSKYTKIFKSNDLTRQKYDELYAFAVMLRDHKNLVSEYVNSNLGH